jgi:hypothetical protein
VKSGRLPVGADVRCMASQANEFRTQLDAFGYGNRLNDDIGTKAIGEAPHDGNYGPPNGCSQ